LKKAIFRFYAELNDFLRPDRKAVCFEYAFSETQSIKQLIEALGVPHTEVEIILVNGRSVDFQYQVEEGDRISVYPTFEALDVAPLLRLRPQPLRRIRFIADVHLGRLATYLRLLGFDTLYDRTLEDDELVRIACSQRRLLLTRDRELLKRRCLTHALYVHAVHPRQQALEVLHRTDLKGSIQPFSRCLQCNTALEPVAKESIADRVPSGVQRWYSTFWFCSTCDLVFWQGSHHRSMQQFVAWILSSLQAHQEWNFR
jgi:uncharacterized protein with PIN domain/sulfur carrier protein ThiS